MRRQNLSLRRAARIGGVPLGTLFFVLDAKRLTDPNKRPKRCLRKSTLLLLRSMGWVGSVTTATLDRLLASGVRHPTR